MYFRPLCPATGWRHASAREVVGHWRKAGRRGGEDEAPPVPREQLSLPEVHTRFTRMLQRDGNPTPLGEAIQHYGRIFKSLHILALIDDEGYRRDVHWIRNLQEGRHAQSPVQ